MRMTWIALLSSLVVGQDGVGKRKQFSVDDWIVAKKSGVTHMLGQVTKANGGRPIFTDGWFYGTVLRDEERFKLWYRKPGSAGFGYAESHDGFRFEKRADLTGINSAGDYTLAVELDAHEIDPQHRCKAAYDAPGMAAGIAHSGDGIRWTPYNDGKPVTGRAADTYNQILWDGDAPHRPPRRPRRKRLAGRGNHEAVQVGRQEAVREPHRARHRDEQ